MEDRLEKSGPGAPHVVFVLPGLGAGGAERVVAILANQWVSRGISVSIVTFEMPGTEPYYALDPRVRLVQIGVPPARSPLLAAALHVASRIRHLRKALRELSPTITLSFLSRANIQTLIAAPKAGPPVIVSERNNALRQTLPPVWKALRTWFYPKAFALVVMTRGEAASFPEMKGRRVFVIPNPVEIPTHFRSTGSDKASSKVRTLTAVGRLVHQKGFDLLLRAFAAIAADCPDWTLTIWGEGPERDALLRQRNELGLDDRVTLPGLSDQPGSWIETADAFVFSSRFEGWGNVLSEAMAAGLPVVSYDCDWGPRDMIEHGVSGLLARPEDVDALAGALRIVLEDEALRARLGEAARVSSRRFETPAIMQLWDDVVEQAIGRKLPTEPGD